MSDNQDYEYKPSHRYILLFVSVMFIGLGSLVFALMPDGSHDYLFPVIVFGGGGLAGLVFGLLASDRAIARIWGSR